MNLQYSLPTLEYDVHGILRKGYKYADDLLNDSNWKESIHDFSFIRGYIDDRDKYSVVEQKELRDIGLSLEERTLNVYQTMSGEIINNYIYTKIGNIIINTYEHYSPDRIPEFQIQKKMSSIIEIDTLPNEISKFLLDLSTLDDKLTSKPPSLQSIVSSESVEFHKSYIKDNNYENRNIIGEVPNIMKYGLYPEIIGNDIATLFGTDETADSISFSSSSLFGWNFVSPQQRTVGSAGFFGCIIMDILFKNKNKAFIDDIETYYNPLAVESNIINELSKINEDSGLEDSQRNPCVLGIKYGEYRKPDIYALWCIFRTLKTPFYDREKVDSGKNIVEIENYMRYDIKNNSFTSKTPSSSFTKKTDIIEQLEKSITLKDMNTITEFNAGIPDSTLSDTSIKLNIIDKLKNLSNEKWTLIVSHSVTCLYLNLLLASTVDWVKISSDFNISGNSLEKKEKIKIGNDVELNNNDILKLRQLAESEFIKLCNVLQTYIGFNKDNAMGGLSLYGTGPFSLQKYGKIISYPGDVNVMENVSEYISMFVNDIHTLENNIKKGLYNMQNFFWKRDVLRWLEILFLIFEPHKAPLHDSYSTIEINSMFFKLEKNIKVLYSKQINIIVNYLQKLKILQKRRMVGSNINKSLEQTIKLTSAYTKVSVCYIKRQIHIIYSLFDYIIDSWWLKTSLPSSRKIRPVSPAFRESQFLPAYRNMKGALLSDFRSEISRLATGVTDSKINNEIRSLGDDLCGESKEFGMVKKTVSNVVLSDNSTNYINNNKFWLTLVANLKNINISEIQTKKPFLKNLYIPVYSGKKFYLFDIIPFVLEGKYGTYIKTSPQWLNSSDLTSKSLSFPKNNKAIIMISNNVSEIGLFNKWRALPIKWFENVYNKASSRASYFKNDDKSLFIIRIAIHLMLTNDIAYSSLESSAFNEDDKLTKTLQEYQMFNEYQKEEKKRYVIFMSRDELVREIQNTLIQIKTN